ncbi:TetR family transcriptional regulator [Arcticibacter tournemirensis]|uniref:TetR/AcrR family transcriptional regulator n=1 Tax=Arcticibacter tournemirensis TaxID=699437 RepID=A0A4Q0M7B5_9SPHI|nr:TetR/AcrR family transcriptional regulator [Arcticibacter tournemirensis]KAA8484118.1 TetR/AcrR family transcriptional regulator [Arcticibacter tournemirensis]RXF68914.1 TetR/AcrR family transcriptional regulator [Arcticibacter tournemirensis]TQM51859.1 TetR family transcriptional regulator [Arcticibacter tournemirensis]
MANTKALTERSTEEKIKEAARKVFTQKGYAATRTRDIAEEADINLALLNYYFRSKEKLFNLIMFESFGTFIYGLKEVLNNRTTSLDEKLVDIVNHYIDMLTANPDLPLFIMSEIRTNSDHLLSNIVTRDFILDSYFFEQYQEESAASQREPLNPLQLIMTIVGTVVFPFIASPLIKKLGDTDQEGFDKLMQERRELAPKWIRAIINTG